MPRECHSRPVLDADLSGLLRRIRRTADLSQRELADRLGTSKSGIGRAETGSGGLDARLLVRAAELAGLRLTLLDAAGCEVAGMADVAVRDEAGRRYPAHLDVRHGDEDWWYAYHRYGRRTPWYTFDRTRWWRDEVRARAGIAEDHMAPDPSHDPQVRRAARRRRARLRADEERRLRFLSGALGSIDLSFPCECPPGCDATAEQWRDVHVPDCPCRCDLA
jgi:HTH-type transcriptional regulator/antitoxin HipB